MRKGGYKIISLKSSTLYEDIESNYYKPLLLTDIVIDGVDKHDLFVNVEVWDGNYIIDAYDRTIAITPENQVTMTEGGKHLYKHLITISYSNQNDENQYVYLTMYLNTKEEINTKNKLKTYLARYGEYSVTGTVNYLEALTISGETLPTTVGYSSINNDIYISTINDENTIEYSGFTIRDKVNQIF